MPVIEELDKFKKETNELGRNARGVIRRLDALRERGRLGDGVRMDNGGILKIIVAPSPVRDSGLEDEIPDNKIIRVAYWLQKEKGENVFFVSKDINARIKADALGIEVMDFEKQKINFEELFSGYCEIGVKPEVIDSFYANHGVEIPGLELLPNEFVNMISEGDEHQTALGRAGEGTKMILTGDPYQIDNPYLDASSNGLAYAVERMKTQAIHGHVTLTKSERSTLAAIAANLL